MPNHLLNQWLAGAALGLGLLPAASAQNPYPTWLYSGSLYVLTTPAGANLTASASETNFPLLVRLNPDFFNFSQAKVNGADVRFATTTGTNLAYQIEEWTPATGTAVNITSATQMTVTTPAHAPGPVSVFLLNTNGLSATSQFTYVLPPMPAALGSVGRSGADLQTVWAGGAGQPCVLLSATNLAQPRSSWTPVSTNAFGPAGLATNQFQMRADDPQRFFLLSIPYN